MTHPSPEQWTHYVLGALAPELELGLEGHAATCSTCAEVLAREARLETALLAASPRVRASRRRRARWDAAIAAPLALAASVLLVVWLGARPPTPSHAQPHPGHELLAVRQDADELQGLDEPMDAAPPLPNEVVQ